MAVQRFRLDLSQASFPLMSDKASRAVLVPSLDQQGRRRSDGTEADNSAYTRPQILHMYNVLPVREGYRSVAATEVLADIPGASDFKSVHPLVNTQSAPLLYSAAAGKNYIFAGTSWTSQQFGVAGPFGLPAPEATSPNTAATATITTAVVEGYSFVCYSRLTSGLARSYTFTGTYDPAATALTVQALAGAYNVTFTLGSNPELTVSGRVWTLAIPSLALPVGSMSLISTMTIGGSPVGDVQTVAVGTDMSLLSLSPLVTNTLQLANGNNVTNLPFDPGTIDGVAASNGYLLLWSGLTIAWAPFSTDTNSFDWTLYRNGAFTGAGYQIPEAIAGNITAVASTAGGFIMFTATNAVAATYHANNINAPWVFREIPGAGGVQSLEHVTVDSALGHVYAYTTAGMQKISLNSATGVFPEIGDLIRGGVYEVFLPTASSVKVTPVGGLTVKVACIANRYLCVSFGDATLSLIHTLVYDLTLERWGVVSADRQYTVDCFEDTVSAAAATEPKLAFLQRGGSIVHSVFDLKTTTRLGRIVIGRIQLSRSRNTQLQRVELEGISTVNYARIRASTDGRTINRIANLTTVSQNADLYVGGSLIDCLNFDLVVSGTFNLTSVLLEATTSGVI